MLFSLFRFVCCLSVVFRLFLASSFTLARPQQLTMRSFPLSSPAYSAINLRSFRRFNETFVRRIHAPRPDMG